MYISSLLRQRTRTRLCRRAHRRMNTHCRLSNSLHVYVRTQADPLPYSVPLCLSRSPQIPRLLSISLYFSRTVACFDYLCPVIRSLFLSLCLPLAPPAPLYHSFSQFLHSHCLSGFIIGESTPDIPCQARASKCDGKTLKIKTSHETSQRIPRVSVFRVREKIQTGLRGTAYD